MERIGIDAIDRIGVARIAKALGISRQAVRKWRRTERIPDDRQDDIRRLLRQAPDAAAMVAPVAEVADATKSAPSTSAGATKTTTRAGGAGGSTRDALAHVPVDPPRIEQIAGVQAKPSIELIIAARGVDQAKIVVEKAATDAEGQAPTAPVRGYKTRLAILFALDFPILTMAFVAVTQVSPIVAAGSAIALSLGLVLCAHAAGAQLRSLTQHAPAWFRDLIGAATMLSLIAAVIAVATDLRLKGFEVDGQLLASAQAGIFDQQTKVLSGLPEPLIWAIVRAAGLVTVLSAVFGISWSYRHHGPQLRFARAEAAYRKALRRYARAAQRSTTMSGFAAIALTIFAIGPAHAAECDGPSILGLIDTTTAYDDRDREQIMPAIDAMAISLAPESRLVIRTVRDAPSASRLLLDACAPPSAGIDWSPSGIWRWLIGDPSAARSADAAFRTAIRDALLPELHQRGDARGTALVATLAEFGGDFDRLDAVWLFTDLLDSVESSAEALISQPDALLETGDAALALARVDVHVAGVGRFHDDDRRPLTSSEYGILIDSWTAFIRRAGGELHIADSYDRAPTSAGDESRATRTH
ncbi:MAG: hypothetical protein AAF543_09855 [Pseudomonadota bacterium]